MRGQLVQRVGGGEGRFLIQSGGSQCEQVGAVVEPSTATLLLPPFLASQVVQTEQEQVGHGHSAGGVWRRRRRRIRTGAGCGGSMQGRGVGFLDYINT